MKNQISPILLTITILCTVTIWGQLSPKQQSQIDSLNAIISNSKSHDTTLARAYVDISSVLFNSNPDTVIYLCNKTIEIVEKYDNKEFSNQYRDVQVQESMKNSLANAFNNIGTVYYNTGDIPSSLEYFTKGLKVKEDIGDKKGISLSYNNIGYINFSQGNIQLALEYYNKSLIITEEINDHKGISRTLNNIGLLYYSKGNNRLALDYYKRSLKIKEDIDDIGGLAKSYSNIGGIYLTQGEFPKAMEYFNKNLSINEKIGYKKGIANSYNNIGGIYQNQGETTLALEYFNNSLKIQEEIEDKQGIGFSLNNIGLIYSNKGNSIFALDYYNKSLKIQEEINNKRGIAFSLNSIGVVYSNKGDYTLALDYYRKSLKIRKEIGDSTGISSTLHNIGNINLLEGKYKEATTVLKKSYITATRTADDIRIKNAARSLLKAYILCDSIPQVKKYLNSLINKRNQNLQSNFFTLSENEKQLYFSTMEADYGLYYDFALNYHNQFEKVTDTSYNIALQNKGITLKSSTAMRQSILESSDTTLIKNYENWLNLKKKIANTNTQDSTYQSLKEQAVGLERQLVKESNTFNDFDQMINLKWQDVQTGLKNNEAAIEFVHFKSEIDTANPVIYAALIVKKDSKHPKMVKLCTETDLKEILGTFQGNNLDFVNSVYGNKDKAQKALYEKVWQPMEKNLEGVENIYLSPSGLLHKIAFSAIAKDKNTYLCDNYNIRQQNSTGKIALPNEVAFNNDQNFLMLGGVQYNTDTSANEIWSYLPGTLEETTNIKSYLKKKKFNITHLTAAEAGEEQFKTKAPEANILHIATHGFFFPDPEMVRAELKENQEYHEDLAFRGQNINPDQMQRSTRYADWTFVKNKNPLMRSGLALAHANDVWQRPALAEGEDGVLTANEVSTLNLQNTDLVVLSACETGLGDIKGSEGVYGLQRAFKMAGAKYLIMSLWQVPDKETAEFMELFYKHLIILEDIPEAFNKTQKAMRKKYDPYYWAAFVLVE